MAEAPLIGPPTKYPTPWTAAYQSDGGRWLLLDLNNTTVAISHDEELARTLVRLVNRSCQPGAENLFEANAEIQDLGAKLDEALAEIDRLRGLLPDGVKTEAG